LDFGFTTSTTVANSSTLPVPDSTLYKNGGWYVIGGVGNAAKTASLAQKSSDAAVTLTTVKDAALDATAAAATEKTALDDAKTA
jgi:hypothetical protein